MIDLVLKREYQKNKLVFIVPDDDFTRVLLTGVLTKCKQKHGDYVQVSISTPKKKRTQGEGSQNRKFHKMVQEIANETGADFEYIKMHIKREAIKRGFPYVETKLGVTPVSSADVSTVEFSYLIEQAYEVGAFIGMTFSEDYK